MSRKRSSRETKFIRFYNENVRITDRIDQRALKVSPGWGKIKKSVRYRIIHIGLGVDFPIELYKRYTHD